MGIVSIAQGRCPTGAAVRAWARKSLRLLLVLSGILAGAALFGNSAQADPLANGIRAFTAQDYITAARIFTELAARKDPIAQTYLGYMYATGTGVPQDFVVSAAWYGCASQQGIARAQYQLGLMYDKAQGVQQDYVLAYALLNLAVAGASPGEREPWVRIRDAVASKLSLLQRSRAQQLSFAGVPEHGCLPILTGVVLPPFPFLNIPQP